MPGKDLPVITFDGESLLNVLLYGSDKFSDEIDKKNTSQYYTKEGRWHRGGRGEGMAPHSFVWQKIKVKQRKKEKVLK